MSMMINAPVHTISADNAFPRLAEQGSTGQRVNSAADDAAGSAIAGRLTTQFDGLTMAARNIGDGLSMLRTRSGMAGGLVEQVQRMRELSIQANSSILSPQDRIALNQEFVGLRETVVQQLNSSEFNGQPLFRKAPESLQTGPNAGDTTVIEGNDLAAALDSLDFGSLSLSEAGSLGALMESLDGVLDALVDSQVKDGASANRLMSQADNIAQSRIDSAQSRSRIEDTDFAALASELAKAATRDQAQVLVQSQANAGREDVLRLLTS